MTCSHGDNPTHDAFSRRAALVGLGAVAAGAGGCGTLGLGGADGESQSLSRQHFKVLSALLSSRGKSEGLKREDVAKIPYSSMSVRVGGRGEQLILLNRIEGQKLLWLSGDQIMLVTRGGRLVQTSGLRFNLIDTSFNGEDPIASDPLSADGRTAVRVLDFDQGLGRSIEARSTFRFLKKDPIEVLGAQLSTVLLEEKVRVPLFKWRFKNRYWVHERTGFVWRSRQRFHPDYAPLVLTVLRPAKIPA